MIRKYGALLLLFIFAAPGISAAIHSLEHHPHCIGYAEEHFHEYEASCKLCDIIITGIGHAVFSFNAKAFFNDEVTLKYQPDSIYRFGSFLHSFQRGPPASAIL